MPALGSDEIDYIEAGSGPLIVLVHSSVAGARQWRKLIETLSTEFAVRAINLFGYGKTAPWPRGETQTLDDQARLLEAIIPLGAGKVSLVGHSFGGSVAMRAAIRMANRIDKLVLLEPNPFTLLRDHGCDEAFVEVLELRAVIKENGMKGAWMAAAEHFADYWSGKGTWSNMDQERRTRFADALKPNFHEWDAIMGDATSLRTWAESLPKSTLVVYDPETTRPIREIVALFRDRTLWRFEALPGGGHMAPMLRPELVNPIIQDFLQS